MLKNNKKEKAKKIKILKLNLSATMIVAGIIVFIILAIAAVRMIVTAINSNSQKSGREAAHTTGGNRCFPPITNLATNLCLQYNIAICK